MSEEYKHYFGYSQATLKKKLRDLGHEDLDDIDHQKGLAVYSMSAVTNMASLAFGAYGYASADGYEETTTEGTKIKHLNWDMLNSTLDGVLKITLHKASRDWSLRRLRRSIEFNLGYASCHTKVIKYRRHFSGEETHYLGIRRESVMREDISNLTIRISNLDGTYDPDNFGPLAMTSVSTQRISLNALEKHPEKVWEIMLQPRRAGRIHLSFSAKFMTFEEACAELGKEKDGPSWESASEIPLNFLSPDWTHLIDCTVLGRVDFVPYAYIDHEETSTQCWIFFHKESKTVVVSYRGTEADRVLHALTDVGTDLSYHPRSIKITNSIDPCLLDLSPTAAEAHIEAHEGFAEAYQSIRKAVLEIVYDLTEQWNEEYSICVTGHSLGGSLSTLAAFEYANRYTADGKQPHVSVMTFGAVKTGLSKFIDAYNKTVLDSYRLVAYGDVIPALGRSREHVNMEIQLGAQGQVKVQEDLPNNQASINHDILRMIKESSEGREPDPSWSPGILEHLPGTYHTHIVGVLRYLSKLGLANWHSL